MNISKKLFVFGMAVIIFTFYLGIVKKDAMAASATGVACKAPCINSFEIEDGQVTTTDIADGAVTGAKMSDGAVSNAKIQDGAVTDAKITGTISSSKIQKPANVIVVAKSGGDFTSIQATIDSINPTADNPYLIKVMPGTYVENVTMKSYIHLQGAGRDVTTIQGSSGSRVIVNNLINVTISGFMMTGSGFGIYIDTSSPTIKDNTFTGNSEGIESRGGEPIITGNRFINNQNDGIWLDSASPTIADNIFTGNGMGSNGDGGIAVDNLSSPIITGNKISGNNPDGISDWGWGIPSVTGNVITGNSRYGINHQGNSTATIANNRITGNGGATYTDIYVRNSTPNISFNIYDDITGTTGVGSYNVNSNGEPAPAP